jgi:hypothetical protein
MTSPHESDEEDNDGGEVLFITQEMMIIKKMRILKYKVEVNMLKS